MATETETEGIDIAAEVEGITVMARAGMVEIEREEEKVDTGAIDSEIEGEGAEGRTEAAASSTPRETGEITEEEIETARRVAEAQRRERLCTLEACPSKTPTWRGSFGLTSTGSAPSLT
jgi:hypothetical protein